MKGILMPSLRMVAVIFPVSSRVVQRQLEFPSTTIRKTHAGVLGMEGFWVGAGPLFPQPGWWRECPRPA